MIDLPVMGVYCIVLNNQIERKKKKKNKAVVFFILISLLQNMMNENFKKITKWYKNKKEKKAIYKA